MPPTLLRQIDLSDDAIELLKRQKEALMQADEGTGLAAKSFGLQPCQQRDDEKQFGEYRTKRVILEIYDEMQRAMESGEAYQTRLDPPPADPHVAHEAMESGE